MRERAIRKPVKSASFLGLLSIAALAPLARAGEEELRRDVKVLASDEYEGRGTASKGGALAADYVEKQMRAAGLETRRQRFPFQAGVKVGMQTVLTPGKKPLPTGPAVVYFRKDGDPGGGPVEYRPLGFSASGDVMAPLVFCGYGISAPEVGWDDYAGVNVSGKVVLILDRVPQLTNGKPSPLSKDAAQRYGQLRYKIMTAREKGAKAVLVTARDWDTPAGDDRPLLSLESGGLGGDAGIMVCDILRSRASHLLRMGEGPGMLPDPTQDGPVGRRAIDIAQAAIESSGAPLSRELEGMDIGVKVTLVREKKEAENVLGIRRGTDPALAEEAIIVGAHMDHLGHGEVGGSLADDPKKREIHNGADDNASGTAALLDLARRLPPTRRPVIFIAFSGEEMGLLGSAAYVKDPWRPLAKAPLMINMDMVGRLEKKKLTVGGMGTAEEWAALVPEAAKRAGIQIAPENDGYGPSDHSSFYGKGVPVLFLFTGAHADYHKPSDDWDKIDYAGTDRITGFAQELVVAVDALEKRPTPKASAGNPHGGELEPSRGPSVYLGTIPDYSETERTGVRLSGVREGSPAAAAGLKAGDVIVSFDGHEVRNVQDYTYVLFAKRPGEKVAIVVERGDGRDRIELSATMGRKGGAVATPPEAPKDGAHGEHHGLPPGHPPVAEPPKEPKGGPTLF